MAPPRMIRAATFNVHSFVGLDGRTDVGRSLDAIRGLCADVVALQEVLLPGVDAAARLKEMVGDPLCMRSVAGSALLRPDAAYGNALVSRLPLASVRLHDISVPGREPRGAMDVIVEAAGERIRVVVAHFGLRKKERRVQADRLLSILRHDGRDEADGADALILLGDFNEWLPRNRSVRRLDASFGKTPSPPTFPSRCPVLGLDRIWVSPGARLRRLQTVKTRALVGASDHLPLVADILVGPDAPKGPAFAP